MAGSHPRSASFGRRRGITHPTACGRRPAHPGGDNRGHQSSRVGPGCTVQMATRLSGKSRSSLYNWQCAPSTGNGQDASAGSDKMRCDERRIECRCKGAGLR
eukprot:scaffold117560_cov33-Tisochrysis_lutea.AAC.3